MSFILQRYGKPSKIQNIFFFFCARARKVALRRVALASSAVRKASQVVSICNHFFSFCQDSRKSFDFSLTFQNFNLENQEEEKWPDFYVR